LGVKELLFGELDPDLHEKKLFRWLFPELALFETVEQRKGAWEAAEKKLAICRTGLCIMIGVSAFGGCATGILMPIAMSLFSYGVLVLVVFLSLASGFVGIVATYWLFRMRIQKSLRESLLALGMPVRLHCGYCLRGLAEPRCPECGKPFDSALLGPSGD